VFYVLKWEAAAWALPVMKEGDHIAALEMLPEEYRDAREPGREAFFR